MFFRYFEDQSWLDLFLLALPVLVPFVISLYFIRIEEPNREAHVDPTQVRDDPIEVDKYVASGSDEAKESHETTQNDDYVSPAIELLASARHLSDRLRTLNNCIQYRLDNARLLYLRSELKIAALYLAQNRIRDLEAEADGLAQAICGLLDIQEMGSDERDQVMQWRNIIWGLGQEIERVIRDMNCNEQRREYDEHEYVNDEGLGGMDGRHEQRSTSPLSFADGIHLPDRLNGSRQLVFVDDLSNSFPRGTRRCPWTTRGVTCQHTWPSWLSPRLPPHKPRHDLERLPSPDVTMPICGFPAPNQEASEMATARRRYSEEEGGGAVLPSDSWTHLPDFSCQIPSKTQTLGREEHGRASCGRIGAPLPDSNAGDVPESRDIFEDPWYPDGFRLPDAEDEEEQAEYGSGLCDSSRESKLDAAKVLV